MSSAKFQVGKTYTTRLICDSACVISATIAKRTASTVTLTKNCGGRDQVTFRVSIRDGVEQFAPLGRCSMSPTIRAA